MSRAGRRGIDPLGSVADLDAGIRELRAAGDHAAAATLAASAAERFPDEWLTIAWWRVGALAAAGDGDAAISVLQDVLLRGGWFPWDWLVDEELASMHSDERFDKLLAECRHRQHDEVARSTPSLSLVLPKGPPPWPALIALHGNGENAARAMPSWSVAATRGWLVALPQSGSPVGPLRYGWAAATTGEIVRHVQTLQGAGMLGERPLILSGFARGAYHALRLALTGAMPARGVVAISPAMNTIEELLDYLPAAAGRGLRVAFHIGDRDRQASRAVPRVAEQLEAAGMRVSVARHAGLARAFPPGFDAILPDLLDELLQT